MNQWLFIAPKDPKPVYYQKCKQKLVRGYQALITYKAYRFVNKSLQKMRRTKKGLRKRPARDGCKKTVRIRGIDLRTSVAISRPTRLKPPGTGASCPAFLLWHNRNNTHAPHLRCFGCFSSSYEHCTAFIHLTILKLHYTDTRILTLTDIEILVFFWKRCRVQRLPAGGYKTRRARAPTRSGVFGYHFNTFITLFHW